MFSKRGRIPILVSGLNDDEILKHKNEILKAIKKVGKWKINTLSPNVSYT